MVRGVVLSWYGYNESKAILLHAPEDFKNLSYDAVSSFHKALQGEDIVNRLIEAINLKTTQHDTTSKESEQHG